MKLRVLGHVSLVAAGAAMLLAGCGSAQPGAAAVVGDTTISMGRADDTAVVYCKLTLLSAPEGTPVNNADVRRQAVTDLVFGVVAREMSAEANIEPNPSTYEISPSQRKEIAAAFPEDEVDAVVDAIEDSQHTFAIAQLLGAEELDEPNANPEQVRDAGFQLIQGELARRDVRFDPRFAIGSDGQQNAPTGSLSVPVEAPEPSDVKELPATQRCSG
ncbi:hypothetical protein [Aeromicrobium sp.]|uniref:hypothetical protein n=1 Tax=Aeromicrobium sp. TaxID=1871063 RepID=UPI003D6B16AB